MLGINKTHAPVFNPRDDELDDLLIERNYRELDRAEGFYNAFVELCKLWKVHIEPEKDVYYQDCLVICDDSTERVTAIDRFKPFRWVLDRYETD